MQLKSGVRLGPYEVGSALGAGGMGEVYRARDTRLDRTVAIKVLPEQFAADPQFRDRFDREARAISQLDHPHICALYDVGVQDGTAYLVMQYLEGETLADRLARSALPLDQALTIATEVGSALDKAHRAGIVHRDLKPGNIMLTKTGAKLLDFGLAKSIAPVTDTLGRSALPTTPANLTAQGTILGTFQYMSPEQIEGREADARSDIFAFGAVLYEMVTGKPAFAGTTYASLISSILRDEPRPIVELQPLTPPLLNHIITRCLAKDPDERWQSAADLTRELRWIHDGGSAARAAAPALERPPQRRPLVAGVAVALAGLVVGIAGTVLVSRLGTGRTAAPSSAVARVLVNVAPAEYLQSLPADRATVEGRPGRTTMAWSPDERSVVFSAVQAGRQQLYRRALDQLVAVPIPGTDGAADPFFSPDGQWVGFWSDGQLKKIAADGSGPATTICDISQMFGASWGADGTIFFSLMTEGVWRVSANGGTPEVVTKPDRKQGEVKFLLPQILPGGRVVLFTVGRTPFPTWEDTEIVVQSLVSGERKVLIRGGADGRYTSSGHLVYLRRGTLMAVPFDLERLEVVGGAVGLIADVMQAANTPNEAYESGAGQFSISQLGSLLYVPGGIFPDPERSVAWVDRTGAAQPLALPARSYASPRLSPDGRRVLVWTQGDRNVWIHDLARGTMTRLTSEARNARAIWTPDGARVTYGAASRGVETLFWRPADGSGPAEPLSTSDHQQAPSAWSPDGETLAYTSQRPDRTLDIWVHSLSGGGQPRPVIEGPLNDAYPEFSPDGRWLAYASNESGRFEVYVQPYPGPGPRHQVSTDGGTAPAWSRDSREMFFTNTQTIGGQATPTTMMVVPITVGSTFSAGTPRVLFKGVYGATASIRPYDVTADGRRFLMVQQKERPLVSASSMVLVQNWFEELKARVPVN